MERPDAVSGPQGDNAGRASKPGIDDAISAAIGASESKGVDGGEPSSAPKNPPKDASQPELPFESSESDAGDDAAGEDAATVTAVEGQEGAKALSPPKHWPEADKQAFAKLGREGQEIALKLAKNLEGGFTRKSQELSDQAKFAQAVRGLFADDQTRYQLQASGLDEVGYVQYLHKVQQFAARDKVGYLKWAMQNLGVSPADLGFAQDGSQAKQEAAKDPLADLLADPKVSELEARLSKFEKDWTEREQAIARAEQARRIQSANAVKSQIASFREMQDDAGQLLYPHFDAVHVHMGALMDSDPDLARMADGPDKLKAAYDMAVWARPDLRQSLLQAEAQKQAIEAQKKRDAERAKKATAIKPSQGVSATKQTARTLDDALNQATSKYGF